MSLDLIDTTSKNNIKDSDPNWTFTSNGNTRTATQKGYFNPKTFTYHNIKYNTDGNDVFTIKEQIDAMKTHYNLTLNETSYETLAQRFNFKDITLPKILADDKSGKSEMKKIQKTFEDKMHEVYEYLFKNKMLNKKTTYEVKLEDQTKPPITYTHNSQKIGLNKTM